MITLTGTEKQIAWAETIRAKFENKLEQDINKNWLEENVLLESQLRPFVAENSISTIKNFAKSEFEKILNQEDKASWWIERRNCTLAQIVTNNCNL